MAWLAGILKLVLIDLFKMAGLALVDLVRSWNENRKRMKRGKESQDVAKRIENANDSDTVRNSVDDLP